PPLAIEPMNPMTPTSYYSTFPTDLGLFSVAVNEAGAVVATAFGGMDELMDRRDRAQFSADEDRTKEAREQIAEYLGGRRADFDLPLAAEGSPFQQRVWAALCQIPRGETRSYGAVARELASS